MSIKVHHTPVSRAKETLAWKSTRALEICGRTGHTKVLGFQPCKQKGAGVFFLDCGSGFYNWYHRSCM